MQINGLQFDDGSVFSSLDDTSPAQAFGFMVDTARQKDWGYVIVLEDGLLVVRQDVDRTEYVYVRHLNVQAGTRNFTLYALSLLCPSASPLWLDRLLANHPEGFILKDPQSTNIIFMRFD